ncbi:ImmA/IrrE family metallo-endopeptidase [Levilactobacillus tongjiangensis]|uniref:ImmA/IrrE family metallo-endopeptidase n=1 Tax=Levilactobacillus tongjiangensis TaxID=2486023 RepID=A0ABW1SQF6_9LACO|nr:ImmA/IrrE family metallo-endopeptidase [Levilactobacillus tongjiangensis]
MTVLRVPVAKSVISWAVTHGEKSQEELRQKYQLQSWINPETDRDYPTFKQLQNFSRDTRIPFNYFFQAEVPHEKYEFASFRTVNNTTVHPSRRLIETIHTMAARQEWMKDYLIAQDDGRKFKLIGSLSRQLSPEVAATKVHKLLELEDKFSQPSTDEAFFNQLRKKISSLGIMVMQNGVVGTNTHRPLDVAEFRAFILADEVVPLIFLNSTDSRKAKIFSLVHEFIHALLGDDEILNVSPDMDISHERWINQVTSNVLLPAKRVTATLSNDLSSAANLKQLSRIFHTSLVTTAIRLNTLGLTDSREINWAKTIQGQSVESRTKESGGDFYNTAVSRVDRQFADAVISDEACGRLPVNQAAEMLGVTLKTYAATVDKLCQHA